MRARFDLPPRRDSRDLGVGARSAHEGDVKTWKAEPLPANRARLKLERSFDASEWEAIQLGSIPEEMEDKWFIYEEGGWLNFHRSSTGICIFRVCLQQTPTGVEVAEVWVNRNKEQYTCVDDDYDAGLVSWLIDVLLLKRPAAFPTPAGRRHGAAAAMEFGRESHAGPRRR